MSKGVIYLFMGGSSYAPRLAISLFSLRQYYDGPISILNPNDASRPYAEKIAGDERIRATVHPIEPTPARRHAHYVTKANLPKLSPYDESLFIDADTTVHGPMDEMFPTGPEIVLTQWSNWISTGRMMSGRIRRWESQRPDLTAPQLAKPFPAVNTGVMGLPRTHALYEEWDRLCRVHPIFIADEVAMQILYPTGDHRLLSDLYNCSPMVKSVNQGKAHLYHYHGGKHSRTQCRPYFIPPAQAAIDANIGGMKTWAGSANDEGLNVLLKEGLVHL